jgi:hypothetical protein
MLAKIKVVLSRPLTICIISIAFLYFGLLAFLTSYLHFDSLTSDVYTYWRDSLNWIHPFSIYHVPGYPLLIAFLRGITFNYLPPLFIMHLITLFSVLISESSVFLLIKQSGATDRWAISGALLFILWPFVGLIYAIYPVADLVAMAFYLVGLLYLLKGKTIWGGIFLGLSMVTHKALWPISGLTVIIWTLVNWRSRRKEWLYGLFFFLLPFIILWLAGANYYQNIFWIVSYDVGSSAVITSGQTSIFSSLAGLFRQPGLNETGKSLLTIINIILVVSLLVLLSFRRNNISILGLPIIVTILLFIMAFSYDAQMYTVRYARLLALPITWQLWSMYPKLLQKKGVLFLISLIAIVLILTQFIMAWYLPVFFNT